MNFSGKILRKNRQFGKIFGILLNKRMFFRIQNLRKTTFSEKISRKMKIRKIIRDFRWKNGVFSSFLILFPLQRLLFYLTWAFRKILRKISRKIPEFSEKLIFRKKYSENQKYRTNHFSCVEKTGCFIPEKSFFKNYYVLANFVYPPKGNFLYPFPSPFPLPKTERKKDQKKEKRQKKGTKKRENFLRIFPVDPPIFLSQKEEKRKENRIHSYSHFPLRPPFPNKKKERKEERKRTKRKKRNKKKWKWGEKEDFSRSHFLSQKLKKRRVFRKKKSRKKERKIGRTSFIFSSCFSPKKKKRGKR